MTEHPRVFISYSHDSQEHIDKVLAFADRLRQDGINCILDQYETSPPEGWPNWMDRHIADDDYILVICTEIYHRRYSGKEKPGRGLGVKWESTLTAQHIYDADSKNERFIPVLFETGKIECIPTPLRSATRYNIDNKRGYEDLYRHLTQQPRTIKPELGKLVKLPTRERKGDFREALTAAVSLSKLPSTSANLFGREKELKLLDATWEDRKKNIISLVAWGGVGKTALVNRWLLDMGQENYRGAQQVFGWSFYSQGAKEGGQASADLFFAAALEWFGDPDPAAGSMWSKSERLAVLINETRTLLILDGLEPLQYPPGDQGGRLKDPGLGCLLKTLSRHNTGLVVVSTRLEVTDIQEFEGSSAEIIFLENLSPLAGARYLDHLGVKGLQKELHEASGEFGGHALALSLLGGLLIDAYKGDARCWREVGPLEDDTQQGAHARRVIRSYELWLGESPELAMLSLMGLFDRPAERGAITELLAAPAISKLTDTLKELSDRKWRQTLAKLRRARLLSETAPDDADTLDTHPLVREYFREQLQQHNLSAWREAHGCLFEYYQDQALDSPDYIGLIVGFDAAVAHGCQAGRHQEALEDAFPWRVRRDIVHSNMSNLVAYSSDLYALSSFFEQPWSQPDAGLTDEGKANVLGWAGPWLLAVGRLEEAFQPTKAGLEAYIELESLESAAIAAGNLSELYLTSGDLTQALKYAQQSVDLNNRCEDSSGRMYILTTLANALHQAGQLPEAESMFYEAEVLQKEMGPEYKFLYSKDGFQYCDLLLSQGKYEEVLNRANWTFDTPIKFTRLLNMAFDNLSFGLAYLLQTQQAGSANYTQAEYHLNQAMDGLRKAGKLDDILRGQLARAELRRVTGEFELSHTELQEALSIATQAGMRLIEVDCHLEYARLYVAQKKKAEARKSLDAAAELIKKTGYHRRDGEVAQLCKQL